MSDILRLICDVECPMSNFHCLMSDVPVIAHFSNFGPIFRPIFLAEFLSDFLSKFLAGIVCPIFSPIFRLIFVA